MHLHLKQVCSEGVSKKHTVPQRQTKESKSDKEKSKTIVPVKLLTKHQKNVHSKNSKRLSRLPRAPLREVRKGRNKPHILKATLLLFCWSYICISAAPTLSFILSWTEEKVKGMMCTLKDLPGHELEVSHAFQSNTHSWSGTLAFTPLIG